MGMDVFRPPSVFSYFSPFNGVPGGGGLRGPEFGLLSTSTALARANFVNTLVFTRRSTSSANAPNGTSLDSVAAPGARRQPGGARRRARRAAAARHDVERDAQQHRRRRQRRGRHQHAEAGANRGVSGRDVVAVSGGEIAMHVTRREFLLQSGQACLGYALGAAAFTAGVARFSLINAFAQGSDYRALVCVFLAGGNDGNNMVVPTTTTEYNAYAGARATRRGWPSRTTRCCRSRPPSIGSPFGLHPSLAELQTLWDEPEALGGLQRRSAGAAADARRTTRAARRGPISCSRTPIRSRSGSRRSPIASRRPGGAAASPIGRPLHPSGFPTITAISGGLFTRGQTTVAAVHRARRRRRSIRCSCSTASAPRADEVARRNSMQFLRTIDTDPVLVGAASRTVQQALDIGQILNSDVDARDGRSRTRRSATS